jgi:hypothetical protein
MSGAKFVGTLCIWIWFVGFACTNRACLRDHTLFFPSCFVHLHDNRCEVVDVVCHRKKRNHRSLIYVCHVSIIHESLIKCRALISMLRSAQANTVKSSHLGTTTVSQDTVSISPQQAKDSQCLFEGTTSQHQRRLPRLSYVETAREVSRRVCSSIIRHSNNISLYNDTTLRGYPWNSKFRVRRLRSVSSSEIKPANS